MKGLPADFAAAAAAQKLKFSRSPSPSSIISSYSSIMGTIKAPFRKAFMSTDVIRIRRNQHASIALFLLLGSILPSSLGASTQSIPTSLQSQTFENGYKVGDKEELRLSSTQRLKLRKIVAKTPRTLKKMVRFTFAPYSGSSKKLFFDFLAYSTASAFSRRIRELQNFKYKIL